jgi:MFS family permease
MTVEPALSVAQPVRPRPRGDWHRLWSSSAISTIGDGALLVVLPLIATSLTKSPLLIAAVPMFGRLPWLLFSLHAGAWVDRLSRRGAMVAAQLSQGLFVTLLAVAVTTHTDQLWMLYVLAFGITTGDTLFGTASQTIVPHIVDDDQLVAANGRLFAIQLLGEQSLGPAIGAALVVGSLSLPLWLDAISFLISLLRVRAIKVSGRVLAPAARQPMRTEIAEGVRWLMAHQLLRTLTITAAAGNLFGNMFMGTLVLFSARVLHLGSAGFGVLLTVMAAGGVIGGFGSKRIVSLFDARTVAIAMQFIVPGCWLSIGLFGRNLITVGILASVASLCVTMWNVVVTSLRQQLVPDELRGRVNGVGRLVAYGTIPLGYLLGGLIAGPFGLIAPWIVAGSLRLVVSLFTLPALRRWH